VRAFAAAAVRVKERGNPLSVLFLFFGSALPVVVVFRFPPIIRPVKNTYRLLLLVLLKF
jgi:hypothetical protein